MKRLVATTVAACLWSVTGADATAETNVRVGWCSKIIAEAKGYKPR